jgi:hypothetical protein
MIFLYHNKLKWTVCIFFVSRYISHFCPLINQSVIKQSEENQLKIPQFAIALRSLHESTRQQQSVLIDK